MSYKKPEIVAVNQPAGSFAAGCPAHYTGGSVPCCKACERTY